MNTKRLMNWLRAGLALQQICEIDGCTGKAEYSISQFHGRQEKLMDARITLRLSDFLELAGLKEQAGSTINPHENKAPKINSKLPTNKNRKVKR